MSTCTHAFLIHCSAALYSIHKSSGSTSLTSKSRGDTLGTECTPMNDMTSAENFDEYGDNGLKSASYWVLWRSRAWHGNFGGLSRPLTRDTIISGLKIPQMLTEL